MISNCVASRDKLTFEVALHVRKKDLLLLWKRLAFVVGQYSYAASTRMYTQGQYVLQDAYKISVKSLIHLQSFTSPPENQNSATQVLRNPAVPKLPARTSEVEILNDQQNSTRKFHKG
jgi:hypothetical protein